ncbi:hypothetical protein BD626DRAFT_563681 [Schizophyllum amplum]|uniref:Plasma membrane fusion protein PRM1 n=1 Tax=Schizophyllum amplum TaxID=97359 RepID=A0A550CYX0_9AGAR|nr:hypothetical protein BD626DRAFT_563681 [Auriculariopsis ampla]
MSEFPRWMSPPPTYDATTTTTAYALKPYLELPHLLSLTWLAYPILSLLFVAFRLAISSSSMQDSVDSAKDNMIASCKAAENAATSSASLPRYMAMGSNELFADSVNATMNAARATMVLALTIMEAIINFIIDIYRSTLLCFVELVIRGGISLLISAADEVKEFVENIADGLADTIQSAISGANSAFQTAIDGVNAINPFGDISAPQIDMPDLSSLTNLNLPTTFQDALTSLNNTVPTFDEIKEAIENVIDTPFELLKADINDTFAGLNFNSSLMSVPETNTVRFCHDLDTSVVDDLGNDIIKATKIGIVIIIVIALCLIGLNCFLVWYKWRSQLQHIDYTRQAWMSDPVLYQSKPVSGSKGGNMPNVELTDHNMLMLQAAGQHPILTRFANNTARRLRLGPTKTTNLTWFLHYIFHPPALACFLIGFVGLLSVQIQLLALDPLVGEYKERAAASADDLSNSIATQINGSMYNQSAQYAADVNAQIASMQEQIDGGVFGWLNTTTVTLNDTLVAFYDSVENAIESVFDDTPLEQPVSEFVFCLLGSKIVAIENALTFLHDNIQVELPTMNDSVLVIGPDGVQEISRPISAAALGGGDSGDGEEDNGIVDKLVRSYTESLKKERIMFAVFVGLWGLVVLIGLCIIFWHSYGKAWWVGRKETRSRSEPAAGGEGGNTWFWTAWFARVREGRERRRWEQEQRADINGLVVPFREGIPTQPSASEQQGLTVAHHDLPSFTPLPSPKPSPWTPWSLGRSSRAEKDKAPSELGEKSIPEVRLQADGQRSREALLADEKAGVDVGRPGIFARIFGGARAHASESTQPSRASSPRGKPDLRISVGRAMAGTTRPVDGAPDMPAAHEQDASPEERSRWSISPTATRRHTPWVNIISPTTRASNSLHSRSTSGSSQSSNLPPPIHPARRDLGALGRALNAPRLALGKHGKETESVALPPTKNSRVSSVPADVNEDFYTEDSLGAPLSHGSHGRSAPFPAPLHLGFDRPQQQPNAVRARPGPPSFKQTNDSGASLSVKTTSSSNLLTPTTRLLTTVPARSSSTLLNQNPFADAQPSPAPSSDARTAGMAGVGAGGKGPVNPFVTPFDDEHQVIILPAHPRKSMNTNPFQPVVL